MGVSGLLPVLKPIQETKSLGAYSGKTIAIDGYAWLHRAVYSCTYELAHDKPTFKYLQFFQRRIRLLLSVFNIKPYFVFDGDDFASKSQTEDSRKQSRQTNKELGLQYLSNGDHKRAHDFLSKSIDVSPEIAKTIIDYLKLQSIDYVVAPYEADSQMVYLEQTGQVDAIMSEDSDLLVFGCQKLLTKFNDKENTVIEIRRENFKKVPGYTLGTMTPCQFRMAACISGCDYTSGIPKMGIKKSLQAVRHYQSMDRVLLKLRLDKMIVPKEFEEEYRRADASFLYPRVFDPQQLQMTTLNPIPPDIENDELELIGECIGTLHEDPDIHYGVALGNLHPMTKELLVSREESLMNMNSKANINSNINKHNRTVQRSCSSPTIKSKPSRTIDTFKFFSSSQTSDSKPSVMRSSSNKLFTNTVETTKPVVKADITSMINNRINKFGGGVEKIKHGTKSKYFAIKVNKKSLEESNYNTPDNTTVTDVEKSANEKPTSKISIERQQPIKNNFSITEVTQPISDTEKENIPKITSAVVENKMNINESDDEIIDSDGDIDGASFSDNEVKSSNIQISSLSSKFKYTASNHTSNINEQKKPLVRSATYNSLRKPPNTKPKRSLTGAKMNNKPHQGNKLSSYLVQKPKPAAKDCHSISGASVGKISLQSFSYTE
ncbi:Rad2 family nuclease [Saccharomycopsis crataegensis]|uniref:Rad2 family nuclease n=1 Tax=Saccharomycopsis crataegensis TaxID=43959 RepID=A0AAV5QTS7_9ASCO|nr:Rad2 family nuclease [Saccharomycopsis crataegensis]